MIKQFQKIKIFIVSLILFCSSLFVICPIGKSGPLDKIYECTPFITIEYNETLLQKPIVPYDQPMAIPITVKAKIGGPVADIVLGKIGGGGIRLIVDMSIAEVSEGCHASVNPPILQFSVSDVYESANATLSLTIDQYLPAFSLKNVKVRMNSQSLGAKATVVKAGNFTQDVPFFVGYYPQLSFSYPDSNVKSISPDKTAYFTIEIQNWGNADTNIISEIVDIPEGWQAGIVRNMTLATNLFGSNFKGTISLNVKPPITFGYHEDRAIIKVKMTPECYNNSEYKGEPYYLYFIVQSRGYSTPGFDFIILIFAFIFVLFSIWKRKNNKIEKEQSGGRKK
jgi:hypothetical protein